jgi:hypothetical protein
MATAIVVRSVMKFSPKLSLRQKAELEIFEQFDALKGHYIS